MDVKSECAKNPELERGYSGKSNAGQSLAGNSYLQGFVALHEI
jgi:hypothetical protein